MKKNDHHRAKRKNASVQNSFSSHLKGAMKWTAGILFSASLLPLCVASTTNYVDGSNPSASDSNPYPSTQSLPWKTIQHAANVLQPGDTVYIMAGIYTNNIMVTNSGTAGSGYITYSAYPGQEQQVVIDHNEFKIRQANYIQVSGLKVQNSPGAGISIDGPGGHYVISGNYTHDTVGSGISVWGVPWGADPAVYGWKAVQNVLIEGNIIEDACHGGFNEQLTIANGVDSVQVCYNTLRFATNTVNGGEGIDLKSGVSGASVWGNQIYQNNKYGIYIDGGDCGFSFPYYTNGPGVLTNIYVFGNTIHDIGDTGIGITSEGLGNLDGIYIYNNLCYSNHSDGILLYDWNIGAGTNYARNITIINNTTFRNGRGGIHVDHDHATGVILRNNIAWNNGQYNVWNANNPTCIQDHNFQNNPSFVNTNVGDFHLQSNSLAINYGTNTGAFLFDFDGADRPSGTYDCGAYEYNLGPSYEVENVDSFSSGASSGVISETSMSGDAGVQLYANGTNASVTFLIYAPRTGNYIFRVGMKKRLDRGIFQLSIAPYPTGTFFNQGSPIDQYAATPQYTYVDIPITTGFGAVGVKQFKFTVVGKNPSSSNYGLVFDYITLIPQ